MDPNSTNMPNDQVDIYQSFLHPMVLSVHATMTAIILVGGPATLVLTRLALGRVKLDLLIFEIGNMGLQLMMVIWHTFHGISFMIR